MSIPSVRKHYKLPWLKRGLRVVTEGGEKGRFLSATYRVCVLIDGERHGSFFHPLELRPLEQEEGM